MVYSSVACYISKEVFPLQPIYGHRIRILHWATDQTMSATLADMDLTASQGRILAYIAHQPEPPCSRQIEEAFQLSHPTVSGILSRLEKKGFIEFQPDPSDRRCKRIHLGEKGLECHSRMDQTITDNEHRMVRNFTPEERQQFADLLQRAIVNMGGSPCNPFPKEEND